VITAARAYTMLGNETLWNVALDCQRALQQADIPHSICGGVAVCLHGYQRNTTDIDIIILDKDVPTIKDLLTAQSFHWDQEGDARRSFGCSSEPTHRNETRMRPREYASDAQGLC